MNEQEHKFTPREHLGYLQARHIMGIVRVDSAIPRPVCFEAVVNGITLPTEEGGGLASVLFVSDEAAQQKYREAGDDPEAWEKLKMDMPTTPITVLNGLSLRLYERYRRPEHLLEVVQIIGEEYAVDLRSRHDSQSISKGMIYANEVLFSANKH